MWRILFPDLKTRPHNELGFTFIITVIEKTKGNEVDTIDRFMYNKQESTREQHNPGSTLCYAIARVTLDKIYKHVTGLTAHMWRLLLTVRFGPYFNSINYEPTFGFLEAHLNRCRNSPTQSPTILHLQVYNGNDDKRLCHLFCNVNVCKQCLVISDSQPLPTPLMVTSTLPTMFLEIIFNCLCCP